MWFLPIGSPPSLVHSFGAFAQSVHGLRGPERYKNTFWVLNLVSGGSGTLEIDGEAWVFSDRSAVLVPPDRSHTYRFDGPVTKTYAHFRPDPEAVAAPFAVVQPLGERFSWFQATILECRAAVSAEPGRAVSSLWHLLWQLASGPSEGNGPRHHPAIRGLMVHLEASIREPFDLEAIARRLRISPTHLNRLCHAAFGLPTAAFVRRLRLERAVHLLAHTGSPVAEIAASVGIPDLQHFNKLVRRHTGRPPRELRLG